MSHHRRCHELSCDVRQVVVVGGDGVLPQGSAVVPLRPRHGGASNDARPLCVRKVHH